MKFIFETNTKNKNMDSALVLVISALVLQGLMASRPDLSWQVFELVPGTSPSESHTRRPIAELRADSLHQCTAFCFQNPCCLSALYSEPDGNENVADTPVQCILYDLHFAREFRVVAAGFVYMYKTPPQGEFMTFECPLK